MVEESKALASGKVGETVKTASSRIFTPPHADLIKSDIKVILRSPDLQVDQALQIGEPVRVRQPVRFRIDARPGVDRWAYAITRDGRQIAGAGPVARSVYIEVAPKSHGELGLFPGEVMLRAWGIRNDGAYSPPVAVPLVVE